MMSVKRLVLLSVLVIVGLIAVACGDDPTAVPTATAAPPPPTLAPAPTLAPLPTHTPETVIATITPQPTVTPFPTIAPPAPLPDEPAAGSITELVINNDSYELRIGPEAAFGYDAGSITLSTEGDGLVFDFNADDIFAIQLRGANSLTGVHGIHMPELLAVEYLGAGDVYRGWSLKMGTPGTFSVVGPKGNDHGAMTLNVQGPDVVLPKTYVIDTWVLEDGLYELRTSEAEAQFGYAPGARPKSTDAGGIVMTFNVGDTLQMPLMRISGSRGTVPNAFRIPELGIDYQFPVGSRLSDVGITWLEAGTFQIVGPEGSDNGTATVVVNVPGAKTHVIDTWVLEDGLYELRTSESEAQFGYAPGARPKSTDEGGIVMTFNVGDTLKIPTMRISGSRGTVPNAFRIPELGIDYQFAVGAEKLTDVEITWLKGGTFQIVGPEGSDNGTATVVVNGGTTHVIDTWVLEDGLYELRTSESESQFGYAPGARPKSTDEGGIVMTFNVGDTLHMPLMRISGSRGTVPNAFRIPELGIDYQFPVGSRLSDVVVTFTKLGTFQIVGPEGSDNGTATVVVKTPGAKTHVIDTWVLEDGLYELRVSEAEAQFGYAPGARPKSTDGDGIVMTFNVGDTLKVPTMRISGSRGTVPNAFRIPELGIDYQFAVGAEKLTDVEITWLKGGTFQILGPEGSDNGTATVVVN